MNKDLLLLFSRTNGYRIRKRRHGTFKPQGTKKDFNPYHEYQDVIPELGWTSFHVQDMKHVYLIADSEDQN